MDASSIVRRPPFGTNPMVGERGSDTQRRILAAALDVFAEVGFSEARVELITELAGCSRPAFYQYFSSKDDVFWKLAGRLGHEMVSLADGLDRVTPDEAGLAALAAWIDEFIDLYGSYAPVFSAFQAASRDHQPLARSSSSISERMADALLRAFGVRKTARSTSLAAGVVAVLIRCSFYSDSVPGALDRPKLVEALSQMIHRLFAGPIDGVNTLRSRRARRPGDVAPAPEPTALDADRSLRPRGEKTRQRLLDAGASVLPARGYHDARVDDIVEAAGVSHGTFYRYFENKDDFFRVLAEAASAPMIAMLDDLVVDADPAELRSWLREWFRLHESNGGVISTWQEMTASEELADFSQQVAASVLSRLVRALAGRDFGDPVVDAVALLALLERLPYLAFTLQFTEQADAIETMVTIIRRGLMALRED